MRLADSFLVHYLDRFDKYPFELDLHGKQYEIGEGKPLFRVIVHKDIPKAELLSSTSLSLGEAYMRGDLEIDGDLFQVLRYLLEQMSMFTLDRNKFNYLLYPSEDKSTQKEEISAHYDLGNDFYKLWLDPTLSYSCAYFEHDTDTLEQAQRNKVAHTLRKLRLEPGMTLLDIGCGWGYLLLEAAKQYGVKGFGCTLSREQYDMGQARIRALGLEDQVEIALLDYRDLPKTGRVFDRVVSVGMLEHVGRSQYDRYMDVVEHVLKIRACSCCTISTAGTSGTAIPGCANTSFPAAPCRPWRKSSNGATTVASSFSTWRVCAAITARRSGVGTRTSKKSTTRFRRSGARLSCVCGTCTCAAAPRRSISDTSTSTSCCLPKGRTTTCP